MTAGAANDSGADIAAGFATLARLHHSHLRVCRWYVQRVALVQGGIALLCLALGAAALLIAAERDEPGRSIMRACAVLNGLTILLCARTAFRAIRDACREAAEVRRELRRIEADAAAFEASRTGAEKTLPAELTQSVYP